MLGRDGRLSNPIFHEQAFKQNDSFAPLDPTGGSYELDLSIHVVNKILHIVMKGSCFL